MFLSDFFFHDGIVIPDHLKCPLTLELFVRPVLAADGFFYEEESIRMHIASKRALNLQINSPKTGANMNPEISGVSHEKVIAVKEWKASF